MPIVFLNRLFQIKNWIVSILVDLNVLKSRADIQWDHESLCRLCYSASHYLEVEPMIIFNGFFFPEDLKLINLKRDVQKWSTVWICDSNSLCCGIKGPMDMGCWLGWNYILVFEWERFDALLMQLFWEASTYRRIGCNSLIRNQGERIEGIWKN